ncbi:oligopeptide transporter, OPT family [Mobiluncus mulieris 28-1]|uniref:OPT family oligopeptide transporter n=1 Tax=Mobiluncus mulieris TaxID=2052 RepID=UPI00019F8617|nr:oligopeptide transporter, OPT family [Mobiluncus mulieris]EEJ53849.1 oligopeptide transporter, OPT family [Mobiluncus mulieris ATCC 35243]EEZ91648.1 oligopeptide transporter, OPT family [Mobiluncus mulieris 28-1]MCV0003004.1 oligopeptide transporter, OPT family [Mobiluncus mulieris]SPX71198.1 oligopeptide transporter, OPT family [Mobiluncus mulieris]
MSTGTPKENTHPVRELTIRGIILGGLITLIFTAANAYLGLKVGLTFATSIPAAVISMAVLHYFKNHTVVENNIVQTIASAAGTLSAIIFVIPGLVMVGYWSGFPYWETTAVCMIGGILGVMYSIPLRRALVTGSDLPYPEGVAAAEVLKVGDQSGSVEENKRGLLVIIWGGVASALVSLLAAMKVMAGTLTAYFRVGGGATMVGGSLSLALLGVGHLVGPMVGIAMAVGFFTSYAVLLPIMTPNKLAEGGEIPDIVGAVFSQDVRMIGAGAMAVAAIWTLIKILGPIFRGMKESLVSSRRRASGQTLDLTEQDIPFKYVALITLVSMIPTGFLLWNFLRSSEISHHLWTLIALSIVFVLVLGLLIASICGYMAGLIGASNSPISGVGILVIIAASLLILLVTGGSKDATEAMHLTAYALFTTAIVFGIATISNDNLQDLKTGQLVKATPWRQQVALIIGVVFGSLIIPPVLQLLMTSFGFAGMEGVDEDTALQAPQAILLSTIAKGIFGGDMKWNLFAVGVIIGVVVVIIDEILGRFTRFHLPPLAVGMGMYLNITTTLIIVIGAFVGMYYDRWAQRQADSERSKRLGVLLATGLIVGDSLFGILNAGIIGGTGNPDALAVIPDGFEDITKIVGLVVFVGITVLSYRWVQAKSRNTVEPVS